MAIIYIIDSYAWAKYFTGSKKGEKLKNLFSDENNKFLTIECCLAEINGWSIKNNIDFNFIIRIIRANSEIVKLKEEDWIKAGEEKSKQRRAQKDFGLIDALILTKQIEINCKLISGDKHFKNMRNIIFLE